MATLFSRQQDTADDKIQQQSQQSQTLTSDDQLTPHIKKFLKQLRAIRRTDGADATANTVHVSEIFGLLALLYEKIRVSIEYKREHLVRRNAIERILRRLLWERRGKQTETTAHLLLRELIWAHYLPNDTVPKSKITQIANILNKYLQLMQMMGGYNAIPNNQRDWLVGIASCDIEESLDAVTARSLYVQLMYEWFRSNFSWADRSLGEHEKDIQLYLAIHRALPKSDEAIMRYHLLLAEMPQWSDPSKQDILGLAQNFSRLHEEIERHLRHPAHLPLFRYVKKHAPPFEILQDIVARTSLDELETVLDNRQQLELKIREVTQVKYNQIRNKVNKGIARSVVYIFITKVLLALIIEVPYELIFLGELALMPIGINIVVPPALMFLIGLTIKTPDEKNTKRLINRLNAVIYRQPDAQAVPFQLLNARKRTVLTSTFSLIYFVLFLITFGGISLVLYRLGFNIVSAAVFFIFLSLVLLFGFRVRSTATELKVTGEREGLFGYLLNNLSLPFLNLGVWLSKGIARLNILMIAMDFLIEAPLKTIIEVIEEWTSFMREKREEVVEIPPE